MDHPFKKNSYTSSFPGICSKHLRFEKIKGEFGCHIDAAEQQRALNFELVVSD